MPQIFFEGRTYYVPGVYSVTKVASSLPGPLPAFHVPIVLGGGFAGHPYDADDKLVTGESARSPFKLLNTDSAVGEYFGIGTEIHRGTKFAKRHGLPFGYFVNLSPMTRASIIADTASTDIEQFTMVARSFGPMGGWIKIGYAAGVLTVIPVRRYAVIAANVGGSATRVYVFGGGLADWLTVGATVIAGSNTVAGVSRTITSTGIELDSAGQRRHWVELSSAPGALTTATYAVLLQYATEKTYTVSGMSTSQLLIDYLNDTDQLLRAVKHANFTGAVPATVASPTAIKEITAWNTVVVGTAPAATSADVTAFITRMNAGDWSAFCLREQVVPQAYLLLDSSATSHGLMRDYAIAERTRGYPISVTTGCAWADTAVGAGNSTDPTFRSAALNSQDVCLCAGGLDKEGAYLSLAPAVFGRRVAAGPNHNLTNDELVFSELETQWDEINSGEMSTLCKKGVVSYNLSIAQSIRFRVNQGLSTLQANGGLIWNETDATTWAIMQRDLCDFVDRVVKADFNESAVGADKMDANALTALLNRRAKKSLTKRGYLKPENGFRITSVSLNDGANGFDIAWSVRFPDTVDFITFTTTVLIGE